MTMMMCPQVCSQGQAECPEFPGGGGEGGHGQVQSQQGGDHQRQQGHCRHRHVRGEETPREENFVVGKGKNYENIK